MKTISRLEPRRGDLLLVLAASLLAFGARAQVSTAVTNLTEPYNVAVDSLGSLYVSDSANNQITYTFPGDNFPYTLAGLPDQDAGSEDGPAYIARFYSPQGLLLTTITNTGGLLVSDSGNNLIRFVHTNDGYVTTLAGQLTAGSSDGIGTSASFSYPLGLDQDINGNIYVADYGNNSIRVVTSLDPFTVATLAVTNGSGGTETFLGPSAVAFVAPYYLWVADTGNQQVKVLKLSSPTTAGLWSSMGAARTIGTHDSSFGGSARFNGPSGLLYVPGLGMLISDTVNDSIRLAQSFPNVNYGSTNYAISTYAGVPTQPGLVNGSDPLAARFNQPIGMALDPANDAVVVADLKNGVVRRIITGLPLFNAPKGIAVDGPGSHVYIADQNNGAVEVLDLGNNLTTTFVSGLNLPSAVALDAAGSIYVLSLGTGSVLKFDIYGNQLATIGSGLLLPTALTLDGSTNIYVAEFGGKVKKIAYGVNTVTTVGNLASSGARLTGIALFDDGGIAVSDSSNHVIWQSTNGTAFSILTGQYGSPGSTLGSAAFAKLRQPMQLARAANNLLVAADYGNNRLVVVDRFGAITNALNNLTTKIWLGEPGDPFAGNSSFLATPVGAAVGAAGGVFTTEDFYDDVVELLDTGLDRPGTSAGGGIVVTPPTISPSSGYFPMGQIINVGSGYSDVYYTTDGSEPTTNPPSIKLPMSGNIGFIHWINSTNDLTSLRVKAFFGTNASASVGGQSAAANNIGVPSVPVATNALGASFAGTNGPIFAGIGSTILVPVICNLQTNITVKSFTFRVEVAPFGSTTNPIPLGFDALNIGTNDFVQLVTAVQGSPGSTGAVSVAHYSIGATNGLTISAVGNGNNISFRNFAAIALLKIPIPPNANQGDTYSISVSYPSAASDTGSVPLTAMPNATILVSNLTYTVGDSASSSGAWYNAGTFGDGDLNVVDVNNAFYAAAGLRVPYAFSDVFNAMDAYPPDDSGGFVGGDGQIRYLDWQVILQRALRLDSNNWSRAWSPGGVLASSGTNLYLRPNFRQPKPASYLWYRQVLIGGVSVGNVTAGSLVSVPVYVKLGDGSTLAGLQFRAVITPQNGAPALSQPPALTRASGIPGVYTQQSFKSDSTGFGWSLGQFAFQSRSSNFLGWVTFTVPATAQPGQVYTLSFGNPDGSPNLNTQYDFESRSAFIAVNTAAQPASICSDEWKIHFFGSTSNPLAADLADPDGDHFPNWMEYLAGTDPTSSASRLQFTGITKQTSGHPQVNILWQTAPGKAYDIQWQNNLSASAWTTLSTISGDGNSATYANTNANGSAGFYRLQIHQGP